MFRRVLYSPDLQADQWKIYPCEVVPWTVISTWFKAGTYVPYPPDVLQELIITVKSMVHPWIRLNRVVRGSTATYCFALLLDSFELVCSFQSHTRVVAAQTMCDPTDGCSAQARTFRALFLV